MAKKRFKELKNLSKDEAVAKIRDTEKQLFDAKMQKATGQLTNTATLWKLRKDIARLKTLSTAETKKVAR